MQPIFTSSCLRNVTHILLDTFSIKPVMAAQQVVWLLSGTSRVWPWLVDGRAPSLWNTAPSVIQAALMNDPFLLPDWDRVQNQSVFGQPVMVWVPYLTRVIHAWDTTKLSELVVFLTLNGSLELLPPNMTMDGQRKSIQGLQDSILPKCLSCLYKVTALYV